MEVITIEAQAFKELSAKINMIAKFVVTFCCTLAALTYNEVMLLIVRKVHW